MNCCFLFFLLFKWTWKTYWDASISWIIICTFFCNWIVPSQGVTDPTLCIYIMMKECTNNNKSIIVKFKLFMNIESYFLNYLFNSCEHWHSVNIWFIVDYTGKPWKMDLRTPLVITNTLHNRKHLYCSLRMKI